MVTAFLRQVFEKQAAATALIWRGKAYGFGELLACCDNWKQWLQRTGVKPGTVVMLDADYSPTGLALLLALMEYRCITAVLSRPVSNKATEYAILARAELALTVDAEDRVDRMLLTGTGDHLLYDQLRASSAAGLVLFSSGSTGKSKAVVHDARRLLAKFQVPRHSLRTLAFMLFDHIGGLDTLFYSLANGSAVVTVEQRQPDTVCAAIAAHAVQVLPVTPSFLNLLILSQAYQRYELNSLQYITYGTEVMPEYVLQRCHELFPQVVLRQKYGTTEFGALRSLSRDSGSVWVRVGGEGIETRVVDGILQVKTTTAMLGYLNAPDPFTEDGWLITGDAVEIDGEFMRILGRQSEVINVGGEKVYPAEVEAVIEELDNVAEALVYGVENSLLGQIVCARIRLLDDEETKAFIRRLKGHCREHLQRYKVPVKVEVVESTQYSQRFKKVRYLP